MKNTFVFYAGMLHGTYSEGEFRTLQVTSDKVIYNNAYVHYSYSHPYLLRWGCDPSGSWGRMDGTPMLLSDVPKELLLLKLLLT